MHDTPHGFPTLSHLTPNEALDNVLKLYHDTSLTKVRSLRLDKALAELSATLGTPDSRFVSSIPTLEQPMSSTVNVRVKTAGTRAFHFDTLTLPDWIIAMSPSIRYPDGRTPILEVGNTSARIGDWLVDDGNHSVAVYEDAMFRENWDIV